MNVQPTNALAKYNSRPTLTRVGEFYHVRDKLAATRAKALELKERLQLSIGISNIIGILNRVSFTALLKISELSSAYHDETFHQIISADRSEWRELGRFVASQKTEDEAGKARVAKLLKPIQPELHPDKFVGDPEKQLRTAHLFAGLAPGSHLEDELREKVPIIEASTDRDVLYWSDEKLSTSLAILKKALGRLSREAKKMETELKRAKNQSQLEIELERGKKSLLAALSKLNKKGGSVKQLIDGLPADMAEIVREQLGEELVPLEEEADPSRIIINAILLENNLIFDKKNN